jgi:hypothetical protein
MQHNLCMAVGLIGRIIGNAALVSFGYLVARHPTFD